MTRAIQVVDGVSQVPRRIFQQRVAASSLVENLKGSCFQTSGEDANWSCRSPLGLAVLGRMRGEVRLLRTWPSWLTTHWAAVPTVSATLITQLARRDRIEFAAAVFLPNRRDPGAETPSTVSIAN